MEHLTAETVRALVAGKGDAAAWGQHLRAGCEACEATLEATGLGAHEGSVDLLLLSRLDTREAPLDEVGWQRIRKDLRPRRSPAWLAVPLALAATLAVWVALPARPDPEAGVKGAATPQLELTAAARHPDGTMARVDDGATVAERAVLVFRYHSNTPGPARLWMRRGTAEPRLLGAVELEAGTHELTRAGEVVGLSLEGEVGDVAVWMTPGPASQGAAPVESGLPAAHLTIHVSP